MKKAIALAFSSLLFALPVQAADLSAREIMEKVDNRDDGDNRVSQMRMILLDKNGKQRIRHIKSFDKDLINEKGEEDRRRIMFFLEPADVKDTGFLTYDYDAYEKDDDQWLYLPALKRPSASRARTNRAASWDRTSIIPT